MSFSVDLRVLGAVGVVRWWWGIGVAGGARGIAKGVVVVQGAGNAAEGV